MKIVDYHIHSNNSFDGKSTVEEMCEKAIEIKNSEICFTEHFSVDPRDVSYGKLDYIKYETEILNAKKKYKENLKIKIGLEIGEPHLEQYKKSLENELSKMNLDFIIGSVHNIDGVKLRLFMKNKEKYDVYNEYFLEIYKMVKNSDIDVIGHLDLIKRYAYEEYGNYNFEDHKKIIEDILKLAISKNIGIEINGSGYINSVGEPYPKREILELYKKLGGNIITIGSDSHSVETLSLNNKKMLEMLKEIGFEKICTFENRKSIENFIK